MSETQERLNPILIDFGGRRMRSTVVTDTDFFLQVSQGTLGGFATINKFGENSNVAIGVEEEIWDGSVAYTFPTAADITSVSQTTDQATLRGGTIEVQGLDNDFVQVLQTVDLDATDTTTPVTLTTPLRRIFRMKVLENVVSTSPIRAHNTAETIDYAVISTGNNQTLMAIYCVPAGCTAYVTKFYATVNPATNLNPTSNKIRLWARDNANGYARQIKHSIGLISGAYDHEYRPYNKFSEKTDIFMTAQPVGKAADVSAGFDLILVDN